MLKTRMETAIKPHLIITLMKIVTFIIMTIISVYYSKDSIGKFLLKTTSFKKYHEDTSEMKINPTIVICFQPLAKESELKKLNIDPIDVFLKSEENMTGSWEQFKKQAYYELNKDIFISVSPVNGFGKELLLKEGANKIRNQTIQVERIVSLFAGLCYKLSNQVWSGKESFAIKYSDEVKQNEDNGHPKIFISSEESAYGVLDLRWMNGEESTPDLHVMRGYLGSNNLIRIKPTKVM